MANPAELFGAVRSPRNLVFGPGQRRSLPDFVSSLGRRALIVTDARLSGDTEFDKLTTQLREAGISVRVFDGTIAELPLDCIQEGVDAGKEFNADVLVGIGGGSCIDAAKIISLLLTHGGKASDYYGEFKVPGPILPVIAMPTTSGTGSEVTPVAVLGDAERVVKVGIASPHLIPHTAICDPELTYSCPPALTASSGADALTHAIEAYTTLRRPLQDSLVHDHVFVGKNALSDHHGLTAIRLISASLKRSFDNGGDHEARQKLMLGATTAGLAFGTAGTAAAHAVQYPVGAMTHTPHGVGVAVMLPYVMAFNRRFCEAEFGQIGEAMGLPVAGSMSERALQAIDGVATLFAAVDIPRTIADLGVQRAQLPLVAEQAMGSARLIKNNPRPLDNQTMLMLVEAAFDGDLDRLHNS
ncbi:iron-containing alcohol dehydrogenase [Devosia naphthalenivorans]|uniref:iron-containing alcohol dehydrogenase n=1 Tax=Devosia naphthalenivorans TaxID=2082392 RepID=UPI000D36D8FB|nr:iron-containing alcohol dehydrogenase [Devosia naphthalenivorans]